MSKRKTKIRIPTERQVMMAQIRWEEIRVAIKYFDARCAVCKKSIIINRVRPRPHTKLDFVGFQYHHLEYRDGEPRRSKYPVGAPGTWNYKKDVLPFVEKYHNEFLLVDTGCHDLIESIKDKSRKNPQVIAALMLAVYLTRT